MISNFLLGLIEFWLWLVQLFSTGYIVTIKKKKKKKQAVYFIDHQKKQTIVWK